jgi:Ran GTPase-activating protein (RanGAP) involved in mRNA processing and transport
MPEIFQLEFEKDEYELLVSLYMRGADIVEDAPHVQALTDKLLDAEPKNA